MATNFQWRGEQAKARIKRAIVAGVKEGSLVIQSGIKAKLNLKANHRSLGLDRSPAAPGEPPARATGHLARSIQVRPEDGGLKARIGTTIKYAPIHEYGKTITAKKRALTIPISKQAKKYSAQGQGPRDMAKKLVLIRSRGGNGLLIENKGKGKRAKIIIHWVLRKSVKMPKRPFFLPGFMQSKQAAIEKIKDTIRLKLGGRT